MRLWSALCGLLCASSVALAAADPVLNDAHAAWKARDGNRLAQIAAQARDHVLAPYFEYWQIDLAPSDEPIRRYLARYPKTLLAERLRADWIRGLGRRGDWALIASEARELEPRADDVQCWSLRARWERGDKSATDAILADWSTSREFFEPCIPLAESLVRAGRVSSADVWMRARRLAEGGQYGGARRVLRWLPANQAPSVQLLDAALGTPDKMLTRGLYDAHNATDREMVAFALVRIGNDDPERAARYLTGRIGSLSPEQRSWVQGQLGLVGARKLHPTALEWFRGSGQARLTDEHYGWWVRMAARDAAWSDVGLAIELMSPGTRRTPIWQYWLGRSFAERGQPNAAQEAFGLAAANVGFYGILAADELGGRSMPPAPARATAAIEVAAVARDPTIQRAVALLRADFRGEGLREWMWAIRALDDRNLQAAASFAEASGLWDRAIDTAERTRQGFDLATRYPFAHLGPIRASARTEQIEPEYIFSIARQESRFHAGARSWAGATGLMQVMPATGEMVAASLGTRGAAARLHEIDFNLKIGARYLKSLIDDAGGSAAIAFAGYNAGPGRAHAWRGAKPMEAAAYFESIPFDETRDYVKHVAANLYYYRMRLAGVPANLRQLLGNVPASTALAIAAPTPKPAPKKVGAARAR